MATSKTDEYYRVVLILAKGCTIMTKEMLKKKIRETTPPNHQSRYWTIDEFLSQNSHFLQYNENGDRRYMPDQHRKMLFPRCGNVDLEQWDLSLTITVLRDACVLPHGVKMDLKRLKKIRNKVFHNKDADLSDKKYDEYIKDLKIIVRRCLEWKDDKFLADKINEIIQTVEDDSFKSQYQEFVDTWRRCEIETSIQIKETNTLVKKLSEEQLPSIDAKLNTLVEYATENTNVPGTKVNIEVEGPISKQQQRQVCQQLIPQIKLRLHPLAKDDKEKVPTEMDGALKSMLGSGELTSIKEECVALYVQCVSIEELFRLWRKCVKGELTSLFKPVERSIREEQGLEDVELKITLNETEVLECFILIVRDIFHELSDAPEKRHSFKNALLSCMVIEDSPTEIPNNSDIHKPAKRRRISPSESEGSVDVGTNMDHITIDQIDQISQTSPGRWIQYVC